MQNLWHGLLQNDEISSFKKIPSESSVGRKIRRATNLTEESERKKKKKRTLTVLTHD